MTIIIKNKESLIFDDFSFKCCVGKNGISNNTWIEVERGADKPNHYTWFYYMPGTGNWFNLGKTISLILVSKRLYSKGQGT